MLALAEVRQEPAAAQDDLAAVVHGRPRRRRDEVVGADAVTGSAQDVPHAAGGGVHGDGVPVHDEVDGLVDRGPHEGSGGEAGQHGTV